MQTSKTKSGIVIDKAPPAPPTVNKVTSKSRSITGKVEKGATVYVYNGCKLLKKDSADLKGNYRIAIPSQKMDSGLSIYAVDKGKNRSYCY